MALTEFRGMRTHLRVLRGSRKPQRVGDVFALSIASDRYFFGRVVRNDALWTLRDPGFRDDDARANLIYIYSYERASIGMPDLALLQRDALLVPPLFADRLWWSRGYFQTLENVPLVEGDTLLTHCFQKPSNKRYYDEYNNELARPHEPVGRLSLPNIGWIDARISRALGISEVGAHD